MAVAWKKNADCIVVNREQLLKYLYLDRYRPERHKKLCSDIHDLFPHVIQLEYDSGTFASLFLSRRPFEDCWVGDQMPDKKRAEQMTERGLSTYVLEKLPHEKEILTQLALIAQGIWEYGLELSEKE
jgi:hypothetical protein